MICGHLMHNKIASDMVLARKLNEDALYEVKIIFERSNWGVLLFKVLVDCEVGNSVVDDTIQEGQILLHMGHSSRLPGSFLVGHSSYHCPCNHNITLPAADDNQNCSNYISNALTITPLYRVEGITLISIIDLSFLLVFIIPAFQRYNGF